MYSSSLPLLTHVLAVHRLFASSVSAACSSTTLGLHDFFDQTGIAVLKSPAHAPTANAFCERLIGSIRRECLDYLIPLNESHLKRTLREWVRHYNGGRPHQSLGPGIPDQIERTLQADNDHKLESGNRRVIANSILGGLHHEYRWANAA
jgi:putative transposase